MSLLRLIFNAKDPYEGCYVPRGRQPTIIPWYYVLAESLHFIGHVDLRTVEFCGGQALCSNVGASASYRRPFEDTSWTIV